VKAFRSGKSGRDHRQNGRVDERLVAITEQSVAMCGTLVTIIGPSIAVSDESVGGGGATIVGPGR